MGCAKFGEPSNPEEACKYGYGVNNCNKTSCLKGPDERCGFNSRGIFENCADGLRCCGICFGCHKSHCSIKLCETETMSNFVKKSSPKPIWFYDTYQFEEMKRLQEQRDQEKEQQMQQQEQQQELMAQRNLLEFKLLNRPSYYTVTGNGLEYS